MNWESDTVAPVMDCPPASFTVRVQWLSPITGGAGSDVTSATESVVLLLSIPGENGGLCLSSAQDPTLASIGPLPPASTLSRPPAPGDPRPELPPPFEAPP